MPYRDLANIDRRLLVDYDEPLQPDKSVFSTNTKLGFSIDFPIARTCRPTPICAEHCYGSRSGAPQSKDLDALRKQIRVYHYVKHVDPIVASQRIVAEYDKKHLTFLRWCGVGDLFPEAVRLINTIARLYPRVVQWVVTRRPEYAAKINRTSQNVFVMFSLDATADSRRRMAEAAQLQHARLYFSFLRTHPDDDTLGARVVFNEQRTHGLPNDHSPTVCPADAGLIDFKGACARCRRCFSPRALDRVTHPRTRWIERGDRK